MFSIVSAIALRPISFSRLASSASVATVRVSSSRRPVTYSLRTLWRYRRITPFEPDKTLVDRPKSSFLVSLQVVLVKFPHSQEFGLGTLQQLAGDRQPCEIVGLSGQQQLYATALHGHVAAQGITVSQFAAEAMKRCLIHKKLRKTLILGRFRAFGARSLWLRTPLPRAKLFLTPTGSVDILTSRPCTGLEGLKTTTQDCARLRRACPGLS